MQNTTKETTLGSVSVFTTAVNDIELTEDDLQRVTGGADSGIKHIAYGVGAMGPAGGTNEVVSVGAAIEFVAS